MGNAIYESVVARLSLLVPMLSRTQVDIGLSRVGTDPFHVTAVQMAQASTATSCPDPGNHPEGGEPGRVQCRATGNGSQPQCDPHFAELSLITGVQVLGGQKFKDLVERIVPAAVGFRPQRSRVCARWLLTGEPSWSHQASSATMRGSLRASSLTSRIKPLRQKLWSEVSRIHDEIEAQVARRTAELQASEATLRRKEEHIRAIIESLPVVVYDGCRMDAFPTSAQPRVPVGISPRGISGRRGFLDNPRSPGRPHRLQDSRGPVDLAGIPVFFQKKERLRLGAGCLARRTNAMLGQDPALLRHSWPTSRSKKNCRSRCFNPRRWKPWAHSRQASRTISSIN